MSLDTFKDIIEKMDDSPFRKNLFLAGFGESMLNPEFWDMVKYAKRKGYVLTLPTNGTKLNEEEIRNLRMIDSLQLSVDSFLINKELRDGSDGVLDYISLLKKYRINTQINVTISSLNYNEIYRFIHYSIRNNIPVYLMLTTPFKKSNTNLCNEFQFGVNHINEIKHMISQFHCKVDLDIGCATFENCRYIHNDFAIGWDGSISPCNDGLLNEYDFGNIKNFKKFDDIVNSKLMKEVWNGKHPICNFCKEIDKYVKETCKSKIIYDRKIDDFHNIHKGKRCFILGTGPSVTEELIEKIRNEISIGVNRITSAKELWNFEPSYIALSDSSSMVFEDDFVRLKTMQCPIFYSMQLYYQAPWQMPDDKQLTKKHYDFLKKGIGINWINPSINLNSLTMPNPESISFDLKYGTLESGTVIQAIAIPLAVWMGCNEIYLVGCDGFGGHFYKPENIDANIGYDIIRQYGWFSGRLEKKGIKMYNLSLSKFPNIPNIELNDIKWNEK